MANFTTKTPNSTAPTLDEGSPVKDGRNYLFLRDIYCLNIAIKKRHALSCDDP